MLCRLILFHQLGLIVVSAAPPLRVHVYDYARVPSGVMSFGEAEAARLLAPAGIQVEWLNCAGNELGSCASQQWLAGDVYLGIVRGNRGGLDKGLSANALGATIWQGCGAHATILFDRVLAARRVRSFAFTILGRTMAHEVGHVLLGPNSHARAGIMRPKWRVSDFDFDRAGLWFFTPQQGAAMRMELGRRVAGASLR
jgi:hypothetical protein